MSVLTASLTSPFVSVRVLASGGKVDAPGHFFGTADLMMGALRQGTVGRDFASLRNLFVSINLPEPQTAVYGDGVEVSARSGAPTS